MSRTRGRWEKGVTEREEAWEDALASCMVDDILAALCQDCDAIFVRFSQIAHRHPEHESITGPGMETAEAMRLQLLEARKRLEQARAGLREWRAKHFPSPNGELDK